MKSQLNNPHKIPTFLLSTLNFQATTHTPKTLLILGLVWPEPKSTAAGSRMLQLIHLFKSQNYTIVFASAAKLTHNTFNLKNIDVETQNIKINNDAFDTFIKTLQPHIVIFDRFMTEEYFGWRIVQHCPNALRILDTEDFHGLRFARQDALKSNEDMQLSHLQNDITKRELASIYRCDLSLIISEVEYQLLTETFKIDKKLLVYLPFLLEGVANISSDVFPNFESRTHFVSIGNFLHAPNVDATLYLKTTIWPLIKAKLPKAELHLYGAYSSQKMQKLHNKNEGFLMKGFADDVAGVMQSSKICLAPLRFGAGLKGKLIDAMQNGTPCVMSTIAAEGMFGTLPPNGYIEDNPEYFAQKAVKLFTDKTLWQNAQQQAFRIINLRFNKAHFEVTFFEIIQELENQILQHRQANFVGQILLHDTLQSTKYKSKWISLKESMSI